MKRLIAAATALMAALTVTAGTSAPTAAQIYKKAMATRGVYYTSAEDLPALGTVTVKFGAMNKSKKTVKVSMTVAPFFGRKATASMVAQPDEEGNLSGTMVFRSGFGAVAFNAYSESWEEEDEDGTVESGYDFWWSATGDGFEFYEDAYLGGPIEPSELMFSAEEGDLELPNGYDLVAEPPSGVAIHVKNGKKLAFDKAPSVTYKKVDGQYELWGLDEASKPNYSALKLTYKVQTGDISGSFKVYASNEGSVDEGRKPKLQKYTAKVKGVLYWDGIGEGLAQLKVGRQTFTWPIEIEPTEEYYARIMADSSEANDGNDYWDDGKGTRSTVGEERDADDIGSIAYGNGDEDGETPDEYSGNNPLADIFLGILGN